MKIEVFILFKENMQQNSQVSKNKQEKLNMSIYLEIKEPKVEEKEVKMKDFSLVSKFPNNSLTISMLDIVIFFDQCMRRFCMQIPKT